MRCRARPLWMLTGVFGLALSVFLLDVGEIRANGLLDVSVEKPNRQIRSGGYTTFDVDAVNTTDEMLEIQVIRRVNRTPDDGWDVSVCSPVRCNDSSVDTLEPYTLLPDENGGPKVHVLAGDTGAAFVEIDVIVGYGTPQQEVVSLRLSVEIADLPEPALFVRIDSSTAQVGPEGTARFGMFLLARPGKDLQVTIRRVEINVSVGDEEGWSSRFCDGSDCMPTDSASVSFVLEARSSRTIFVDISAGPRVGSTGAVEVAIDPGGDEEIVYHRFILSVDDLSGVEEGDESLRYPLDLSKVEESDLLHDTGY